MSLRKIRRGTKTDGEDDKVMEQDISIIPKTPEDGNRTLRTRRQLKMKNIDESEVIDSSPALNESKRPGRKVRGKKTAETADESVNVSVVASSRKRTKKDKDSNVTLLTEDSILNDQSQMKEPVSVKKTRARKRAAPEQADADKKSGDAENGRGEENDGDITAAAIIEDSRDEASNEDNEVKAVSKRATRRQAATPINPRTRQLRNRNVNSPGAIVTPESSPITVHLSPHRATKTPRKSPVNIGSPKTHTISPQRTSKTPRKLSVIPDSPISSDKSSNNETPHTNSPKNLFSSRQSPGQSPKVSLRSPRSLQTSLKSPKSLRTSLKLIKSPKLSSKSPRSPGANLKSPKSPRTASKPSKSPETTAKSPRSPKNVSRSPKSPRVSPKSVNALKSPRTPKICLKSPKSKSPRVLSTKIRKSPKKGPTTPVKSPSPNNKSPDKQKSIELFKTDEKMKSPQLVLRKLTPRKQEEIIQTPIMSPSASEKLPEKPASPRRSKSTLKKRSSITSSGTPLRPIPTPKHNDSKISAHKSFVGDTNTPLTLFAIKHGSGLMSSTPREKIRRSLNVSLNSSKSPSVKDSPLSVETFYGKSPKTSTRINNDTTFSKIDDETNPLISDDDSFEMSGIKTVEQSQKDITFTADQDTLISEDEDEDKNHNNTYELDEPQTPGLRNKKKSENDTYELDEPKTPALRKKRNAVETSIIDAVNTEEQGIKRVCRVRFASPSANNISVTNEEPKDITARTATPGNKALLKRSRFVTLRNPNQTNRTSPRRRSNSLSNVPRPKPPSTKKRSLSTIDLTRSAQKTLQNESVSRLSRPRHSVQSDKKPDAKPLSARKIPNFAQIHQKKFEKMESVVDAKKRVEDRHNVLTNNLTSSSVSKLITPSTSKASSRQVTKATAATDKGFSPRDTVNGVFNRFGYKVRKEEATKLVNKKLPTKTSDEKKTEKRTILKGVRSNRRFEMLMQLRKMNQ
ncbi:proteoglycan 4-like [Microplitis mediator]|uniref:proteoglycan 4-like n=1 Tax=Microplitis mediator TaxID=375433 RepID=UPI002554CBB7|nr:proteoglycan 4-like [Microplitis mediator]